MKRRRRPSTVPIDWADVRERLTRAQAATENPDMSPARARALMAERAQRLARKPPAAASAGYTLDVLTFALGDERYAIETRYAREVVRLTGITPVPGVPPFVLGVTNYRGQVLCVLDLRVLLGAPTASLTDLSRLIVLGADAADFGVLADRADDIRSLGDETFAPTEAIAGVGREYVRGVTPDALTILDAAWLLRDPRLLAIGADPGT